MIFASPFFLTVFLPAVLLAAWGLGAAGTALAGRRGVAFSWGPVNALLLAASLLFYFWGDGWGVLWLVAYSTLTPPRYASSSMACMSARDLAPSSTP